MTSDEQLYWAAAAASSRPGPAMIRERQHHGDHYEPSLRGSFSQYESEEEIMRWWMKAHGLQHHHRDYPLQHDHHLPTTRVHPPGGRYSSGISTDSYPRASLPLVQHPSIDAVHILPPMERRLEDSGRDYDGSRPPHPSCR